LITLTIEALSAFGHKVKLGKITASCKHFFERNLIKKLPYLKYTSQVLTSQFIIELLSLKSPTKNILNFF